MLCSVEVVALLLIYFLGTTRSLVIHEAPNKYHFSYYHSLEDIVVLACIRSALLSVAYGMGMRHMHRWVYHAACESLMQPLWASACTCMQSICCIGLGGQPQFMLACNGNHSDMAISAMIYEASNYDISMIKSQHGLTSWMTSASTDSDVAH